MKKSILHAAAQGAGGAAVVGFGAAAGRDLWKTTKKASGTILLLVALAAAVSLPFLGARNLLRGHAPGQWWKHLGDILVVPSGVAIGIALAALAGAMMGEEPMAMTFLGVAGASLVAAFFGALTGLVQRPRHQRTHRITRENEEFIDKIGFVETGEIEISHYDGAGNALRLTERTNNSLVFLAVGKRNKRAYIGLSNDGLMTDYSGVVALGANRDMDASA